jgi:hypothetical protein
MSDIVQIGTETVAEFITRHGGVANTSNIAQRFGWYVSDAKATLEAMAARGELVKVPAHAWGLGGGRVCSWRLPAPPEHSDGGEQP